MNAPTRPDKILKNWPAIRLENQLVFQLETELLIRLAEQRHGHPIGAWIKPALAIGLVKQSLHHSQTPFESTPVRELVSRIHSDPGKDQWVYQ